MWHHKPSVSDAGFLHVKCLHISMPYKILSIWISFLHVYKFRHRERERESTKSFHGYLSRTFPWCSFINGLDHLTLTDITILVLVQEDECIYQCFKCGLQIGHSHPCFLAMSRNTRRRRGKKYRKTFISSWWQDDNLIICSFYMTHIFQLSLNWHKALIWVFKENIKEKSLYGQSLVILQNWWKD